MKLHIENSIVIEMEGKKATLGQGKYEFDSVDEFIRFMKSLGEPTKESLIKDEKIRKAVRAWAEVVGEEETFVVSYNATYHDCCIYTAGLSSTAMIDLGKDLNISEGSYVLAELCGEEEE